MRIINENVTAIAVAIKSEKIPANVRGSAILDYFAVQSPLVTARAQYRYCGKYTDNKLYVGFEGLHGEIVFIRGTLWATVGKLRELADKVTVVNYWTHDGVQYGYYIKGDDRDILSGAYSEETLMAMSMAMYQCSDAGNWRA